MNTYIEGKRKSFYEEYGDGMTAPNDLFDYFIEPALEESFTLGQKSGVELAEGVISSVSELTERPIDKPIENLWARGFNYHRTETLSALSSLKENLL